MLRGARKLKSTGDADYVVNMRKFGIDISRTLSKKLKGNDDYVAATMLVIALDTAHKSVMTVSWTHPHGNRANCCSSPRFWPFSSNQRHTRQSQT